MKKITGTTTPHDRYTFELNSQATIFYNQCRELVKDNKYIDKKGIIAISKNEVTVPKWIPVLPKEYLLREAVLL